MRDSGVVWPQIPLLPCHVHTFPLPIQRAGVIYRYAVALSMGAARIK